MKLSALCGSTNGLKPKVTESPRARYSCGRLEAARALGRAGPASRVVARVARRATAAINQRMCVCRIKILPCSVHPDAQYGGARLNPSFLVVVRSFSFAAGMFAKYSYELL